MTSLHDQVVSILDSRPPEQGVVVCKADGTMLADREPTPGAGCVLVVIDAEPFRFPDPAPSGIRVGDRHVIEGGPTERAASRPEAG
jgi:hypothetical protein